MILLTILWIIYSITEAYEDSQYDVIFNHKPTVYPRIITGILVTYTWHGLTDLPLLSLKMLSFPLLLAALFWFVFELSNNLFRGNYFYFIGTTADTDKWLKPYELPVFCFRVWLVAFAYCLYYYSEILKTVYY